MSTEQPIPTREDLEAEIARLQRQLDMQTASEVDQSPRAAEIEAAHRSRVRSEPADRSPKNLRMRSGADDDARPYEGRVDGLSASAELIAALEASQAALRISEERLALAFEASGSLGWWDWDISRDRLYASTSFADMFGVDPAKAANGTPLNDFVGGIHPDDRGWVGARIAEIMTSGGEFAEEYRLVQRDGSIRWIYARGRCYLDEAGKALRYPGVAIDITERKSSDIRKSALVELGDRLRDLHDVGQIAYAAARIAAKALGAIRAGFGAVDAVRETIVIQPDWRTPGTATLAGLHHFRDYGSFIADLKRGELVIIGDVTTDPRTRDNAEALLALDIRALVNVPVIEHGKLVTLMFLHDDKPHAWTEPVLNFLRTVGDRAQAAIGRVHAEEQQRLLNRELSHRLKNTLAMVQAIAAQTLRNAPDMEAARTALASRLQTLGRAHDILLSGNTESADLQAVVDGALNVHDDRQDRFRVEGPTIHIGPAASLSLSLMLHEMATNAAKYGALSIPGGHVSIEWRIPAGRG